MLSLRDKNSFVIDALNRSLAVIEFTPKGMVVAVNQNFLDLMGYGEDEILGTHHSRFCEPEQVAEASYQAFWEDLAMGKFQAGAFKRRDKKGNTVWLQATYNPVVDSRGRVVRILKFATDITAQRLQALDHAGKIEAIDRSQAVIEFTPEGYVLNANENFLKVTGYALEDIAGRHHSLFCPDDQVASFGYKAFWEALRRGEFQAGEFRRIAKDGQDIFIQATYNPVTDGTGAVVKIVKFATDLTSVVKKRIRNEAVSADIDSELGEVVSRMRGATDMVADVAEASSRTGAITNSVAAAAEELTQSVQDIAHNMVLARSGAEGVLRSVEGANTSAEHLASSITSMTNIVSLIEGIASQINLLALNATIESARAGDAGRGFAVVATEVKSLAGQAAAATKTIAGEIDRVQLIGDTVVATVQNIAGSMTGVLDAVTNVASAIEQQHAVAGEIASNMTVVVSAVDRIEGRVGDLNATFTSVSQASAGVKSRVETLVA